MGDLDVNGRTILKWILKEVACVDMGWIQLNGGGEGSCEHDS